MSRVVKRKGTCAKCNCTIESIMNEKQDFNRFGFVPESNLIPCPNCHEGKIKMEII